MKIELDSLLTRRTDLLSQPIDDDLVMADIESGQYFGLADSARAIWDLLERPATPAAICEALVRRYRVARETCEAEVLSFLRELAREGLVFPAG